MAQTSPARLIERSDGRFLIYIPAALARDTSFPFHAGQRLTASFTPTSLNLTPSEEST